MYFLFLLGILRSFCTIPCGPNFSFPSWLKGQLSSKFPDFVLYSKTFQESFWNKKRVLSLIILWFSQCRLMKREVTWSAWNLIWAESTSQCSSAYPKVRTDKEGDEEINWELRVARTRRQHIQSCRKSVPVL